MTTPSGADLILHNANVISLDPRCPRGNAVAIKGSRIQAIGPGPEVLACKGPGTTLVDCCGKTVLPGFNDAHCHIMAYVASQAYIDCSRMKSIAEVQAAVRERAAMTLPGQWITGAGYNEFYLAEKRHPTRQDLDPVSAGHPVRLIHRTWHASVLNTLAMQMVGISDETEEPPGGIIDRDLESGEPSGILYEMNAYLRERLPQDTKAQVEQHIGDADRLYLSQGITSLQAASVANGLEDWDHLKRLKAAGRLSPRVSPMMGFDALPGLLGRGMGFGYGDDRLRLGAIKIVITQTTGTLHPAQDELNRQVLAAAGAGFPVALHAIEESSLEAAMNALEHARKVGKRRQLTHRIEHASECSTHLLSRIRALGVIVVSQPPFICYSGERYLREIPEDRQGLLYRFRSFVESGIGFAASSDSPVVPNNPLVGVYAAVTRRSEGGETLGKDECLSVEQALAAYTVSGALASGEGSPKGSISVGKLADLVVLGDDPTAAPVERIKDIAVDMTILDGRIVWQRVKGVLDEPGSVVA